MGTPTDWITSTRASSLKLEPFCRGGFGSRSSGPSQCVAVLRTRRDAQRSGQIRPALAKHSLAPPRRVCKRRPPSSSKRLPVAPATGCTLLLLARLAVCKQNCFQLKARRSSNASASPFPSHFVIQRTRLVRHAGFDHFNLIDSDLPSRNLATLPDCSCKAT